MTDGAESLRARRRRDTQERLTRFARARTRDVGFSGFTVEDVCADAGISRRTFFNYFASKEDAVLGIGLRQPDDLDQEFIDARAGAPIVDGVSTTLLDDIATLAIRRWGRMTPSAAEVREVREIVDAEPRLHARILNLFQEIEREMIALVERREGLPAGHLHAETAVKVISVLHHATAEELLAQPLATDPVDAFARRLRARLDAVRSLSR